MESVGMTNLAEKTAEDIINSINIPPQPEVLLKVQQELQQAEPRISILTEAISKDGFLSASLLRIINSPYFGMRCEIKSVHQAMALLGMDHVYNLVASIVFRKSMELDGFTMPRYWDNATDVAKLCGYLARQTGIAAPDQAYTVGLFFDCGIPVLAQQFDNYKDVLSKQNQEDLKIYTGLENQHFNTDHAVVGYYVIRSWGLPKILRDACLLHHDLEYIKQDSSDTDPSCKNLIVILKIAEHVANKHRNDSDHEWQRYKPYILDYLGLSEPDYNTLRDDMLEILDT
jgi:HD-like signal output (HDOD) protein